MALPLYLFALLAEDVWEHEPFAWDKPVLRWLHAHASPAADAWMLWLSGSGFFGWGAGLVVVVLLLLLLEQRVRDAIFLASAVVGTGGVVAAVKLALHRPRPALWPSPAPELSYSFPSGHAMLSLAAAIALLFVARSRPARAAALLLAVPFALLIGVSRLYLGVHYPSDVLAGWAAATALVVGLRALTPGTPMKNRPTRTTTRDNAGTASYRPLREELRAEGNWLFQRRSYLPLIPLALVLSVVVLTGGEAPTRAWEAFCFVVAVLGLAVRIATVGFVPRGTSGRNTAEQRADDLNTTGMYSLLRHPLYLGNFLMWLGVALYPATWWLVVIVVLVFWLYHERIVFAEEEFLRERFGPAFLAWASRTPAFLPRPKLWQPPALSFCGRTAVSRELSGGFGVIATFAVLNLAAYSADHGAVRMDPFWIAVLVAGALVFAVLVFLKKRRMLYVAGR